MLTRKIWDAPAVFEHEIRILSAYLVGHTGDESKKMGQCDSGDDSSSSSSDGGRGDGMALFQGRSVPPLLRFQLLGILLGYTVTNRTFSGLCDAAPNEACEALLHSCAVLDPTHRPASVREAVLAWRERADIFLSASSDSLSAPLQLLRDALALICHPLWVLYVLIDAWLLALVASGRAPKCTVAHLGCGRIPAATTLLPLLQAFAQTFGSRMTRKQMDSGTERLARKAYFLMGAFSSSCGVALMSLLARELEEYIELLSWTKDPASS
jgi:hypothetical protein